MGQWGRVGGACLLGCNNGKLNKKKTKMNNEWRQEEKEGWGNGEMEGHMAGRVTVRTLLLPATAMWEKGY